MFVISIAKAANNWPRLLQALPTAAPLELQLLGVIGIGLVGLIMSAALVGLALGAMPQRLAGSPMVPGRDALKLGVSAGLFAAAVSAGASWLRTPEWARMPNLDSAGAMIPMLQTALDPQTRVLTASAVMLAALAMVDQVTSVWTRRRTVGVLMLIVVGFAAGGVPAGVSAGGWAAAGAITASALTIAYITLLRFDLTIVPTALGTMIGLSVLAQGAQRAYPDALMGSIIAAVLALLIGTLCSAAVRRAQSRVVVDAPEEASTV
jgi:hypothetical protein